MFGLTPYESKKNQLGVNRPRDIFDYFFGDELIPAFASNFSSNFSADIRDLGNEYVIEAEMPGLSKEDIKLDLDGDVLIISAEKKEDAKEERGNYVRRERRYGKFTRSFRFEDIQEDAIGAKFENGILRISLPKQAQGQDRKTSIDIG